MPAPAAPAARAVDAAPSACVCWRVGTVPHAGHCCFDGPAEAYQGDAVLPPCGHWHPALTLADITGQHSITDHPARHQGLTGAHGGKVA